MTSVLIIVGLMVSPVLLAPFVIPRLERRAERRLLRDLQEGGAEAFREGRIEFRERFEFLDPCGRIQTFCGSPRPCGGRLLDVDEIFMTRMKEAGKPEREIEVAVRIGVVCLRCAHLEKTFDSHVLGVRYGYIHDGRRLAYYLKDRMQLIMMGVPI